MGPNHVTKQTKNIYVNIQVHRQILVIVLWYAFKYLPVSNLNIITYLDIYFNCFLILAQSD